LNLLERAKIFVAAKAAKIALTVVPLAALTLIAIPAHAGAVASVTFSPGTCIVTPAVGTCVDSQVSPTGGNALANWIALSSNGAINSSGSTTLTIGVNGSATGLFDTPQNIPISWDFFINNFGASGGGTGNVNWDVFFQIQTSSGNFSTDPSGNDILLGSTEIKGSSSFAVGAATVTGYTIRLTTSAPSGVTFAVTIPGAATLDLNPTGVSLAPEPSSLPLAAFGLLGLLFRRRKKRS
jgi:hypothetical protein